MGPDKDLVKRIEELESDIRNSNRKLMVMSMSRGEFVQEINDTTDDIDNALAEMDQKLSMGINALKAVINKFDTESHIPDPDHME